MLITGIYNAASFITLCIIHSIFHALCVQGLKFPGLPSSDVPGKIFLLDLQDSQMKPVELRMPRNFDLDSFNPHGISVYIDPSGKQTYSSYAFAHMAYKCPQNTIWKAKICCP